MSSSRERNDRSRPSGKPFSKASGPAGKPSGKPVAKAAGKPPFKARGPRPESGAAAYDPAAERGPRASQSRLPRHHKRAEGGTEWLWGWHAVQAALANPNRETFKRLLVAPSKAREIEAAAAKAKVRFEQMENGDIARHLPPGAVHQGIALLADPLEGDGLEAFLMDPRGVLLMLDQLTDPQNVGAIFRSAAAAAMSCARVGDTSRRLKPSRFGLARAACTACQPHSQSWDGSERRGRLCVCDRDSSRAGAAP